MFESLPTRAQLNFATDYAQKWLEAAVLAAKTPAQLEILFKALEAAGTPISVTGSVAVDADTKRATAVVRTLSKLVADRYFSATKSISPDQAIWRFRTANALVFELLNPQGAGASLGIQPTVLEDALDAYEGALYELYGFNLSGDDAFNVTDDIPTIINQSYGSGTTGWGWGNNPRWFGFIRAVHQMLSTYASSLSWGSVSGKLSTDQGNAYTAIISSTETTITTATISTAKGQAAGNSVKTASQLKAFVANVFKAYSSIIQAALSPLTAKADAFYAKPLNTIATASGGFSVADTTAYSEASAAYAKLFEILSFAMYARQVSGVPAPAGYVPATGTGIDQMNFWDWDPAKATWAVQFFPKIQANVAGPLQAADQATAAANAVLDLKTDAAAKFVDATLATWTSTLSQRMSGATPMIKGPVDPWEPLELLKTTFSLTPNERAPLEPSIVHQTMADYSPVWDIISNPTFILTQPTTTALDALNAFLTANGQTPPEEEEPDNGGGGGGGGGVVIIQPNQQLLTPTAEQLIAWGNAGLNGWVENDSSSVTNLPACFRGAVTKLRTEYGLKASNFVKSVLLWSIQSVANVAASSYPTLAGAMTTLQTQSSENFNKGYAGIYLWASQGFTKSPKTDAKAVEDSIGWALSNLVDAVNLADLLSWSKTDVSLPLTTYAPSTNAVQNQKRQFMAAGRLAYAQLYSTILASASIVQNEGQGDTAVQMIIGADAALNSFLTGNKAPIQAQGKTMGEMVGGVVEKLKVVLNTTQEGAFNINADGTIPGEDAINAQIDQYGKDCFFTCSRMNGCSLPDNQDNTPDEPGRDDDGGGGGGGGGFKGAGLIIGGLVFAGLATYAIMKSKSKQGGGDIEKVDLGSGATETTED